MGNCMSMNKLPENMFHVTSISDDKRLGDKGMMQVTEIELIYTDRRTTTSWRWPLKFLRKYGCDGEVFSFEAGRKCPGGEGLYAFSAKRASQIFDMVARNINQGGLQPPAGELSPFPSEGFPPDQNTLMSHRSSSRSPTHNHTDQPNYANMDLSGKPLVQVENGMDPALPPRPVAYKEVVFEQPPEQHPVPKGDKEPKTSYTRIDFAETEKQNRERRLGTLPEMEFSSQAQGRSSTSSVSGLPSSRPDKSSKRQRIHTFSGPGGSSGRSPSESSFSSQGSLTDSTRDVRPSLSSPLTGQSHVSLEGPPTALYQNVVMSREAAMGTSNLPHSLTHHQHQHTPHPPQQQYQNVSVGAGSVRDVFSPTGASGLASRSASHSAAHPRSKASNGMSPVIVNGDPMAHYADLELGNTPRSRATSTPVGGGRAPNLSYSVMEFSREGRSSPNHSSSAVPQPSGGSTSPTKMINGDIRGGRNPHHLPPLSSMAEEPLESNVTVMSGNALSATANGHTKVQDETKVEYGVLNFPAMATLEKMKEEKIRVNIEEREHGHSTGKKKDKK